jgi:hypothetical protein
VAALFSSEPVVTLAALEMLEEHDMNPGELLDRP